MKKERTPWLQLVTYTAVKPGLAIKPGGKIRGAIKKYLETWLLFSITKASKR